MFSFSTISRPEHAHRSTVVWARFMPALREGSGRGQGKPEALKAYGLLEITVRRRGIYMRKGLSSQEKKQ